MQGALAEAVSGVYSGWASIGTSPEAYMTAMSIGGVPLCSEIAGCHTSSPCVHQLAAPLYLPADSKNALSMAGDISGGIGDQRMVLSTAGWNPYFKNEQRTAEPWLLHKFDEDFYGELI
jgi:hypothetical protein